MEGVWIKVEELEKLKQERDELLAALECIVPYIPKSSAADGGAVRYSAAVAAADVVRTAIAKVKEPVATVKLIEHLPDELELVAIFHPPFNVANGDKLYTTPQHAIPDGWQLVPVEPTTGMVEVAWDTIKRHGEAVILVYKRMLAAAPKPENSHDRR